MEELRIAENAQQQLPAVSITDVFLADSDLCPEFSLLLSEKAASLTFEEVQNDGGTRDCRSAEESEFIIFDEDSMLQMSALGLPTSFVASSSTRDSTQLRKLKKSSRTRGRKVVTSSNYPASSEHSSARQGCLDERNHGTSPSNGALGTPTEELPTSKEAETTFPASSKTEELFIDTEPVNNERLCTSFGENPGFSRFDHVDKVLRDVIDDCDRGFNNEVYAFPWMRCWDDYYGSHYFCNYETMETTWELPDGLELYAKTPVMEDTEVDADDKLDGECTELEEALGSGELENHPDVGLHHQHVADALSTCNDSMNKVDLLLGDFIPCTELIDSDSGICDKAGTESDGICKAGHRERRKTRASKLRVKLEHQDASISGAMGDHSPYVFKYWIQRFHLFSKFNLGVKLDEEGWFSVTPEAIAKHQATRCNTGVIVDGFTGVGGNAIQFALAGHYVIAIDSDPKKIEYARHNASIYGVADRIDFLMGDFFLVSSSLQADVVFLSPPWGGPEYLDVDVYDIQTMLQPKDGMSLFKAAQSIAPNIIIFLPRNVNIDQLAELSLKSKPHLACEVERNFLNGKLKAVTAYYGVIAGNIRNKG